MKDSWQFEYMHHLLRISFLCASSSGPYLRSVLKLESGTSVRSSCNSRWAPPIKISRLYSSNAADYLSHIQLESHRKVAVIPQHLRLPFPLMILMLAVRYHPVYDDISSNASCNSASTFKNLSPTPYSLCQGRRSNHLLGRRSRHPPLPWSRQP